jgi:DNA-binding transcriptional MocR family regulator
MGRKRSARVTAIYDELVDRLREGVFRPGERFLSARELAAQYAVSYQTADRILDELGVEGYVERRAASGTYIPSSITAFAEVGLFLSQRARYPQSFGARLLAGLTERLRRADLTWSVQWAETADEVPSSVFPVLWEAPGIPTQRSTGPRTGQCVSG